MKRWHHVCNDGKENGVWEHHVRVENAKEMEELIAYLEKNGFKNVQNLTADNYHFPVLIVKYDYFAGTNATCMACHTSLGGKTLSCKEFIALIGR